MNGPHKLEGDESPTQPKHELEDDNTDRDLLREWFEHSLPDRLDLGGELLQNRLLDELFGIGETESTIGQYLVERRLGRGGMGEVYAGRDPLAGHEVAIKLLRPAANLEREREDLLREARALAKVNSPNVIRLYHIGEHEQRLFIAMEHVRGQTLAAWQRDRPGLREVLRVYAQAARGLAAAHRAGIVHRDFKPSNVLLAADGRVLVSDFGLASVGDERGPAEDQTIEIEVERSTSGGPTPVIGTLLYMAPEQAVEGWSTAASDQFSFFVALFEAIYGERPFPATTEGELIQSLERGIVTLPRTRRRVPRWLSAAILRGLSRDPGRRFPDMDAVAELLRRKGERRPLKIAGMTAAAAVLVAVGHLSKTGPASPPPADVDRERTIVENLALSNDALLVELDEWDHEWEDASFDDPRIRSCLDATRDRFDYFVERLAGPDHPTSAVAFEMMTALPRPSVCADGRLGPPPGLNEAVRRQISGLLFEAEFARHQGRLAEAERFAREAEARAVEIDWPGARIDALEQQALAMRSSDSKLTTLARARKLALDEKVNLRAAELSVTLALALDQDVPKTRRHEELSFAGKLVETLADVPPRTRAKFRLADASEHLRLGNYADAERILDRTITAGAHGDPYLEYELRRRLADAVAAQGRAAEAVSMYDRMITAGDELLGWGLPDAIEETKLWINAGVAAFERESYEVAEELFLQALERRTATLPANDPLVASALTHLGYVELARENYDAALDYAGRAHAILITHDEPGVVAEANVVIAKAHMGLGHWSEALEAIERALATAPERHVAEYELEHAEILKQLGRSDEAFALMARHLPTYESYAAQGGYLADLAKLWSTWLELLRTTGQCELVEAEIERISMLVDLADMDLEAHRCPRQGR